MKLINSLFLATTLSISSYAATDAGSISKDINKQFNIKAKPSIEKIKNNKKEVLPVDPNALKVFVRSFDISGNTLIDSNDIQNILKPFLNKKLTFNEIQNATREIAELYKDRGFSARAFLPPQEVENGIIQIIILEGTLSAIEIDALDVKRLNKDYAKKVIENAHPIGEKLQTSKLEKGLLILSDTPGVTSKSTLVSGEKAGESKVKVKLEDSNLVNGSVSYSNTGSKSTGSHQVALSGFINSPFGLGDQITSQFMKTKGIDYGKISYTFPLGFSGFRTGFNISKMKYDVIDGTDSDGTSSSIGITTSYPIIRARDKNINLNLNFDSKSYRNNTDGLVVSDKTNRVLSSAVSASFFDNYGVSQFDTTLSLGKINLSKVASDLSTDQSSANTQGSYKKLVITASRYQSLTDSLLLNLNGTMQFANKNLDSSEKLSLGGAYGVRAYPSNEASGDEGWLINAEITKTLPNNFSTSIFYDIGKIKQHHKTYTNWQGSSTADNSYLLKGIGTSVSYIKGKFSAKATLAWKHGKNPDALANGNDSDNTNKDPRFWIQLSYVF